MYVADTCMGNEYLQDRQEGETHGTLVAAARLSDRASIGNGYWMTAHGGAVSVTYLDQMSISTLPLLGKQPRSTTNMPRQRSTVNCNLERE